MPSSLNFRRALAVGALALLLGLGGAACSTTSGRAAPRAHKVPAVRHRSTPKTRLGKAAALSANRSLVPVPTRVIIPRLAVSAPVVAQVAVQSSGPEKGLLSAPSDYHELGWYEHNATGVLVIDGHVGFASGSGPLAYIGELKPGQSVTVKYRSGSRTYRVVSVDKAKKGALSPSYFTKAYDGYLMLITCDYLSAFHNGHFADNVFVVAKPVSR